jgi:hypothetical protein
MMSLLIPISSKRGEIIASKKRVNIRIVIALSKLKMALKLERILK